MFCANCGKEVAAGKAFCTSCGALAPIPTDEQPTQPTPVASGQPAAPDQPTAATQAIASAPFGPEESPPPTRNRRGLVALIFALVLLLAAGVAIVLVLLLTSKDDSSATSLPADGTATTVAGSATTSGPGSTAGPGGVVELTDLTAQTSDIVASSLLPHQGATTYAEANLTDDEADTCWAEGAPGYGVGEYVDFTWADPVTVRQVRIVPGYDKTAGGWDRWTSNGRVRTFDLVFSDGTTESFTVTDTKPSQTLVFAAPHTVSSVRFVITGYFEAAPGPHKAEDTSVAELHFWGTE